MENMDYKKECTPKVGYACVPIQKFGTIYSMEDALKYGTIFPELYLPKLGMEAKK